MQHTALHAIVRGRVQGVAFRYATQKAAVRLGLVGWVRNRVDGSVEVWAEGTSEALAELAAWLEHGPPAARVDELKSEQTTTGSTLYQSFDITY